MKIFPKRFVRQLHHAKSLDDVIKILVPWTDKVVYDGSVVLKRVAYYVYSRRGITSPTKFLLTVMAEEIYRVTGLEDLKQILLLSVTICYRKYNPLRGNCDLINYLSWMVPYEASKLISWKAIHPIGPESLLIEPIEPEFFSIEDESILRHNRFKTVYISGCRQFYKFKKQHKIKRSRYAR
jgi:hypothetical protein